MHIAPRYQTPFPSRLVSRRLQRLRRPLQLPDCTNASARKPSCFSSKNQSGCEKGSRCRRSGMGLRLLGSTDQDYKTRLFRLVLAVCLIPRLLRSGKHGCRRLQERREDAFGNVGGVLDFLLEIEIARSSIEACRPLRRSDSNDSTAANVKLDFDKIADGKGVTPAKFDLGYDKFGGLTDNPRRFAELVGHEFAHGLFAATDPAEGVNIQRMINERDQLLRTLPVKHRYP